MVAAQITIHPTDEIKINLQTDTLLTLSEALRRLPTKPSPATAWRWKTKGANGVRLPAIRCGGRWLTSVEAMAEFLRRQTPVVQVVSPVAENAPDLSDELKAAGLM